MGFFKKIQFMQIKSLCIASCRSMSFCFNKFKKKFPESDIKNLLVSTLLTRPSWKRIDDFKFEYKNFDKLTIKNDDNLEKITKDMLWIEFEDIVFGYIGDDRKNAKDLISQTISNFFKERCKKISNER